MTAVLKPKRRWLRRLLLGFSGFIVLIGVLWSGNYAYRWRQREAAIAELNSAGGHVDWETYAAERMRGVPPTPTALETLLKKHAGLISQYPTADTSAFLEFEKKWEPGDYPKVKAELVALKPLFDELGAIDNQQPRPLPTTFSATRSVLYVSECRGLGRILQMECVDAIGSGERERSVRAIKRLLQIARLMRGAPDFIGAYVGMTLFDNTHRMLAFALRRQLLTSEDLTDLDHRLGELYREFTMLPALGAETVYAYADLEDVESLRAQLDPKDPMELLGGTTNTNPFLLFIQYRYRDVMTSWLGRPQILQAEAALLHKMRLARELIDHPAPWPPDLYRRYREVEANVRPLRWGANQLFDDLGIGDRDPIHEAWRSGQRHRWAMLTTRWTLRVARHHALHGRFPETLEAICDSKMPTIDLTWMNGKPPIYTTRPNGFTLELPDDILAEYQRERKEECGLRFTVTFAATGG